MANKCLYRLSDGSFCKRWASEDSQFCSHHQGSTAHLQYDDASHLHPLARLTTPEDVFDLLRETLNAARLGRIAPGQAYAVGYLVSQWRQFYHDLSLRQREAALHRQILPDLLIEEQRSESERAEAPHPLPVRVDSQAAIQHTVLEPLAVPLKPLTDYPGWAERCGPDAEKTAKQQEPTPRSVPPPGAETGPEQHAPDSPAEMSAAALAAALGGNNGSGPAP